VVTRLSGTEVEKMLIDELLKKHKGEVDMILTSSVVQRLLKEKEELQAKLDERDQEIERLHEQIFKQLDFERWVEVFTGKDWGHYIESINRGEWGSGGQPMNEQEKQAIRERCERATKAPWYAGDSDVSTDPNACAGYPADEKVVANLFDDEYIANPNYRNDAEFIAQARTDIPRLLDALDERDREVERLNDSLNSLGNRLFDSEKYVEKLQDEIRSHAPEGRNYTNGQYVSLLQENQRLNAMIDDNFEKAKQVMELVHQVTGENQRLRKALEEINEIDTDLPYVGEHICEIASQALAGEEKG
jgi:hypothetical protein